MNVVVTDTPFVDVQAQRALLAEIDPEITLVDPGDEAALREAAVDADALIVDVNTPVSAETIEHCDDLEVIARAGTGVENVDVGAASEAGVTVVNAPAYSTDEVATHALSLLLACRRTLVEYDRDVAAGEWNWVPDRPFPRTRGSTLGVVSLGTIARRLVELGDGFEFDVAVYDPYVDDETVEAYGARRVEFEELLEVADAVTIHAPLTDETRGLFDAEAFELLSEHAVVVNVGRGGIVDEDALAAALEAGEIAGAGLDVLEEEPPDPDHPLCGRDDVILTPHAAWYSADARADLNETIGRDVARVLQGRPPENPVEPERW